jgi:hypothetical protein
MRHMTSMKKTGSASKALPMEVTTIWAVEKIFAQMGKAFAEAIGNLKK